MSFGWADLGWRFDVLHFLCIGRLPIPTPRSKVKGGLLLIMKDGLGLVRLGGIFVWHVMTHKLDTARYGTAIQYDTITVQEPHWELDG